MSFFSLLETFFFISLAVTFVLIMMLVYHFKGRLVLLEDKCNTMFEIMNSMVKELKSLHMQIQIQQQEPENISGSMSSSSQPVFSASMPFGGGAGGLFPPEFFRLFQMGSMKNEMDDNYEIVDEDETEEPEFKRIVVSDTELTDDEKEDETNVKVINVDINDIDEVESEPLSELEEFLLDEVNPTESEEPEPEEEEPEEEEPEEEPQIEDSNKVEYRKMDVSYLRTMVLTRGLATDTKKMKKSELIRILEEKE